MKFYFLYGGRDLDLSSGKSSAIIHYDVITIITTNEFREKILYLFDYVGRVGVAMISSMEKY